MLQSEALYARARRVMPGGNSRTTLYYAPHPLYAKQGEGAYIEDVEGIRRLDCVNNFMTLIHGHQHPRIVSAVADQLAHGLVFGMPTEAEIALAEELVERVASVEQVRFCNSGSEAVIMAIKSARAVTGRSGIVKCGAAYHGLYDYGEVGLVNPGTNSDRYYPGMPDGVIDDVLLIDFNDESGKAESAIVQRGESIAAIVIDPVPPRFGYIPATDGFVTAMRRAADAIGALLIFDEVASLRHGHGGAQERYTARPDLTAMGKMIGGGFAVGAFGGRAEHMQVLDPSAERTSVVHNGTFNAHPVTMAAGLAAMKEYDRAQVARLNLLGNECLRRLDALLAQTGQFGITGTGSFLSITARAAGRWSTLDLFRQCLDRGIFLGHDGRICLSTAMAGADIDYLIDGIAASVAALDRAVGAPGRLASK